MFTRIKIAFMVTIVGLFWAGNISAQTSNVTVESRVDKSTVTVGEHITYEIIIRFQPGYIVAAPPPGINLGGFEIRDYADNKPEEIDGMIEKTTTFTIAAYDTGSFVIPPTGIAVMTPDSVQDVLLTTEVAIRVESILDAESQDILDIKAPMEIPFSKLIIWLIVGAVVILTGAGVFWYYRRKNRGLPLFEAKKEPDRPAHEVALEALEALRISPLLANDKVKEYYIELSTIVRDYFERRYFQPFLEMTTSETVAGLKKADVEADVVKTASDLLEQSDMVKFAKARPAENVHVTMIERAFEIVEKTKVIFSVIESSVQEELAVVDDVNGESKALPEEAETDSN